MLPEVVLFGRGRNVVKQKGSPTIPSKLLNHFVVFVLRLFFHNQSNSNTENDVSNDAADHH